MYSSLDNKTKFNIFLYRLSFGLLSVIIYMVTIQTFLLTFVHGNLVCNHTAFGVALYVRSEATKEKEISYESSK